MVKYSKSQSRSMGKRSKKVQEVESMGKGPRPHVAWVNDKVSIKCCSWHSWKQLLKCKGKKPGLNSMALVNG